eukprot:scaffold1570_cov218-Chaetoceros_neogracile.AAC.7
MKTDKERIPSLINEVETAFDLLNTKNDAGASLGLSPVNVYKSANLLYQLCHEENPIISILASETMKAFDLLMNSVDDGYLSNIILKDINAAFNDLTEKAKASLQELTLHPNVMSYRETLENDLSKCFAALKPLQIIYGYTKISHTGESHSTRCCRLGFDAQICSQMAFLHDAACQLQSSLPLKECILNSLSCILTFGLLKPSIPNHDNNEDDAIQSIMTLIQQISSEQGETSTCLGNLILWQKQSDFVKESDTMGKLIASTFSTEVQAQKDYVLLMLSSAQTTETNVAKTNQASSSSTKLNHPTASKTNPKQKTRAISKITRLVSQVQDLFPSYGEGYIEAALACYNHNLEQTTAALLELQSNPSNKSIHPRLKALDSKLPSRRKGNKSRYDDDETEEDVQAREVQRAHLKEMEAQQETDAFLLEGAMDEYNDDYDDQYDGIGGGEDGVGGMDGGLYDVDLKAVKAYNRVAKNMEEDRKYWEENRNTNKRKPKGSGGGGGGKNGKKNDGGNGESGMDEDSTIGDNGNGNGDGGKKYRGPDKGKGGRLVGPDGRYLPFPKSKKKGNEQPQNDGQAAQGTNANTKAAESGKKKNGNRGKAGTGNGGTDKKKETPEELTKIQKRRKNDNKAKIGNHHRKDRAMKKNAI